MADPKNPNKNKLEKNTQQLGGVNKTGDRYHEDIFKTFVEWKKGTANYFSPSTSKNTIVADFEEYVRSEHGNHILKALYNGSFGKRIDIEFNQIADKGFTINDFLQKEKGRAIKKQFGHISSETQALEQGMMQWYHKRSALSDDAKKEIPYEDFLRQAGYVAHKDQEGKVFSITMGPKAKSPSVATVQKAWDDFVHYKTSDSDKKKSYSSIMNFDHFDPTQKIACINAVRGLFNTIQNLNGKKKEQLSKLWKEVFGAHTLDNPISAQTSWTTLIGLESALESFFTDAAKSGILTEAEFKALKNIKINSKGCIKYGKESGDLDKNLSDQATKKFSELGSRIQNMANTLAQVDLVTNVEESLASLDTAIDDYSRVTDMPGNMYRFLEQFGTPDQISPNKNTPDYLKLKNEYERIKDRLGEEVGLAAGEADMLEKKLVTIKKQMNEMVANKHILTREQYFDHIAAQVDEAAALLGNTAKFGSQVWSVLTNLQANNRDINTISPEGQNILMKASVDIQLSKIKASDVASTLGYNFEHYRAFVSNLYDFTSKESVIMTKDNEPIVLNFKSKKFVGKPHEWQTIDITDISDLNDLRVEFVLDITDNPDAESFIQALTGGGKSRIVKNFFNYPGFPDTITDSSKVVMTDKNGQQYTGYLSPASFHDDEVGDTPDYDDQTVSANTFVLYDKPADQLHDDRKVVVQKGADGHAIHDHHTNKSIPIYINSANLHEWSDVQILEKNVTLSQQSINSLILGYGIAQEKTKEELVGEDNKTFDTLRQTISDDTKLTAMLQDGKDASEAEATMEEKVKSEGELFAEQRNNLFPPDSSEVPCENNMRLAIKMKDENSIGTPPHIPLLSVTVKNVKKDSAGKVVSCDFIFSNLTGSGNNTKQTKPLSLRAHNLKKLVDKIDNKATINLGDTATISNPSDQYQKLYNTLKGVKGYNMNIFEKLQYHNHPQGIFRNDDSSEKKGAITHFIALHATNKGSASSDKTKYNVEYSVKDLGGGRYEIQSSGYYEDKKDKDGNKIKDSKGNAQKELVGFKATTDLAGIMLILASKNLTPYTAAEKSMLNDQSDAASLIPDIRRYNWSIGALRNFVKKQGGDIVHAWEHKREAIQKDELNYVILNEFNIYRRLQMKAGWMLEYFDMDILDHMAEEEEAKTMDYGWHKIEHELGFLKKFHHSHNNGLRPLGPRKGKGACSFVEEYLEHAEHEYHNKGQVSYKARYRVAASLMYMVEKYKNGYARGISEYPRGTYVKLMFGGKAQASFMAKYREKEKEVQNGKHGNELQEELALMEYNYIVHNLGGGAEQDKNWTQSLDPDGSKGGTSGRNPDAWYFQKLYSRTYGNELRKIVEGVKNINPVKGNKEVDEHIEVGDFNHLRNDFYDHLYQQRTEKALAELVAMQQVATTPEQADEFTVAIMAGMMSGVFMYNFGHKTRDELRRVCRNSGFPLVSWMEHHDAPQKMQILLNMATADLGKESFKNFSYNCSKFGATEPYLNNIPYNPKDFNPFNTKVGALQGFVTKFRDWLQPPASGNKVRNRVISFLHLDNINDNDNNNLMYIWKSKDSNKKIYGHAIGEPEKKVASQIFNELYFNRDKTAKIENYRYEGGFNHPRTMIDAFPRDVVNRYDGASFENNYGDHAYVYRDKMREIIPEPNTKLPSNMKYKMAHYVDEFFRTFQKIGGIARTEDQIEDFYKYIRLAQEQSNKRDKRRLIWFPLIEKAYEKGSIPGLVEQCLAKYVKFFENNLDLFDAEVAGMHPVPGESGQNAEDRNTFVHVFEHDVDDMVYEPNHIRKQQDSDTRRRRYRNTADSSYVTIVNGYMDEINQKAKGIGRQVSHNAIGSTIDQKIQSLHGGSFAEKADFGVAAENLTEVSSSSIKKPPKKSNQDDPLSRRKNDREQIRGKTSKNIMNDFLPKSTTATGTTAKDLLQQMTPSQRKQIEDEVLSDSTKVEDAALAHGMGVY